MLEHGSKLAGGELSCVDRESDASERAGKASAAKHHQAIYSARQSRLGCRPASDMVHQEESKEEREEEDEHRAVVLDQI